MCQFYVEGEQSNYSRYPIRPWTPAGAYIVIFMFYPPCPLTSISLIYVYACRSVPMNEVIMHNQALIVTTEKYTNHDTIYYHHPRGRQTELTPSRYSCASFNLCVSVYTLNKEPARNPNYTTNCRTNAILHVIIGQFSVHRTLQTKC